MPAVLKDSQINARAIAALLARTCRTMRVMESAPQLPDSGRQLLEQRTADLQTRLADRYDAILEERRYAEDHARTIVVNAIASRTITRENLKDVMQWIDRDVSMQTGARIGKRFGHTFLPVNTGWLATDPGVVTARLLAMNVGAPDPGQLLRKVHPVGPFVFLSAVLYLLEPKRYLAWIGAVQEGVSQAFGEPVPPRVPDIAEYVSFCGKAQRIAAALQLPPQAVDLVLFDLPIDRRSSRETPRMQPARTPAETLSIDDSVAPASHAHRGVPEPSPVSHGPGFGSIPLDVDRGLRSHHFARR